MNETYLRIRSRFEQFVAAAYNEATTKEGESAVAKFVASLALREVQLKYEDKRR